MGEQMHDDLAEYQAQLAERDAEIERLRQQVAELQAWKANVPVDALRRYWSTVYANRPDYSSKYDDMSKVHDFLLSVFDPPQEYPD